MWGQAGIQHAAHGSRDDTHVSQKSSPLEPLWIEQIVRPRLDPQSLFPRCKDDQSFVCKEQG